MAPISSITSSLNSVIQTVGGTSGTQSSTGTGSSAPAPAFPETLTTQVGIYALGLGAPRNNGDIEALFAEVATKFGVESETAGDFAEAAEDAKRSTSLRAAAGNLALFASLGAMIDAAQDNIAAKQREIAKLDEQIDGLNAQKDALEDQIATYSDEWNSNADTQLENAGTIIELGFELIGALGDDAETARIQGEIDALESQNSQLFDRNNELTGLIIDLGLEVTALSFQIAGLEIDKGLAKLSIAGSEATIGFAEGLLAGYATLFIPFSVDLALRTIGDVGRASFEDAPDQSGLDKSISDAANNISDQAQRLGEIDAAKKALAQMPDDDPTKLSALNDFLAGKGLPGGESPVEGSEKDAVFSMLALLQQLLGNGVPTEDEGGPQSGMDQIRAALNENLPPNSGNPAKVTSEAVGLAGGLALLRNILGQVAEGESSQSPQVPGPSGRLTLAI